MSKNVIFVRILFIYVTCTSTLKWNTGDLLFSFYAGVCNYSHCSLILCSVCVHPLLKTPPLHDDVILRRWCWNSPFRTDTDTWMYRQLNSILIEVYQIRRLWAVLHRPRQFLSTWAENRSLLPALLSLSNRVCFLPVLPPPPRHVPVVAVWGNHSVRSLGESDWRSGSVTRAESVSNQV
jgi:hypothetical protein